MDNLTETIRFLYYISNELLCFIIKMKKPNLPSKQPVKKPQGGGFGFGDAMFAMKDLQADYAQFGDVPTNPNPPKMQPTVINKNQITNNIKKPVQPTKSFNQPVQPVKIINQKILSVVPKQQFKIAPGKEYSSTLKFMPLNAVVSTDKVYELVGGEVGSKWQYNIFCDGMLADKIVDKPEITMNFSCQDLKQGQLGNCYFITALGSMAHLQDVVRARMPMFKKYSGMEKSFTVYMFQSGKSIEIVVDNMFPGVYCRPVGNDVSPMILEKAYAQVYGNFQVIIMGHASDALRDLTGAPTIYIDLKDKGVLRNSLKAAFASKYPIVIASKKQNINPTLSQKHSYNILDYELVNNQLYLKLRDPRGWTKADFQVPSSLNNTFENGMFWIGEKHLQQNFQVITVCKAMRDYSYFYKTFSQKQMTNRICSLKLTPKQSGKAFITIHQKHKKFYDDKFSYDVIGLLLAEVDTEVDQLKVIKTLKSDFNAQQVCCIEVELQAGRTYIVIGQVGSKKAKQNYPREIATISVYCESKNIKFAAVSGNIEIRPYLEEYMRQNRQEFKQSQTEQGLFRFQGPLFGYICMYYENRGVKQVLQEIEYTARNVEVGEKKVQLAPGQSKLLIHPIGSDNNCSHQISMKTKTYYK